MQVNIIDMLNSVLANFYERDLRKLIEEVNLFRNEGDLWRTHGSVKNSSGNLVLHIIGGEIISSELHLHKPDIFATGTRNLLKKGWKEKIL